MGILRILLLFIICVLFTISVNGQVQNVKAKKINKIKITVKDIEDNYPIDSALVKVDGLEGFTNNNGELEFNEISPLAIVEVAYRGYVSQQRKVKALLLVKLNRTEQDQFLGMVNNGFYKRPIEHFSGAYTSVSGNELRKINSSNFLEALAIYDPALSVTRENNNGSNPNVLSNVKVRGTNNFPAYASIATSATTNSKGLQINPSAGDYIANQVSNAGQPLFILNGAQVSMQQVIDMDINRIEQVTILKDASATAVYGIRASSGVIVIHTKEPKTGDLAITYAAQLQINTADISSYNLLNASDKLQLENAAGVYKNNQALYASRLAQVNKGVNTNWLKEPLRPSAIGNRHSLTAEGGVENIHYGLDFSNNNVQGVMKGASRNNMNMGIFLSAQVGSVIVKNYLTFAKNKANNSPFGNLTDYAKQNPYWDPIDPVTGKAARVLESYVVNVAGKDSTIYSFNPAYNGNISTINNSSYARLSNNTTFDWILGKGFKVAGRITLSKQQDETNLFLPPSHTAFANYQPEQFFKRGQYTQNSSEFFSAEAALQLNYHKRIGVHQFYASFGTTAMTTESQSSGILLGGFTSDRLANISFGNAYLNLKPAAGLINTRLLSGFANFTYSYDNRYQLEVTGTLDASSQFGENNTTADFGAVAVSWNLHQERFFKQNDILNQFRLRAGVGTSGSQNYQSYLGKTGFNYFTNQQYYTGTLGTIGVGLGAYLTGLGNPNLTAPGNYKQNLGLEMGLFSNRLFVRVDGYIEHSKELVLPIFSPASTGFTNFSYYDNLGGIKNKGIEFAVNYGIVRNVNKSIYWSVSANGIHNKNVITAISSHISNLNVANDAFAVSQITAQPKFVPGKSITAIWAVPSLGVDPITGVEKFRKANGTETTIWDANDKVVAGDLSPKWAGSFGTSLTVKALSASIYFNYQLGAQIYNQTLADAENANLSFNVDQSVNSNRYVNGLLKAPTYANTRYVQDNNFINCSSIALNYAMNFKFLQKIKFQNTKLGFIGNNLFQVSGATAQRGIYYPFERLYSFNLTTSF